MGGYATWTNLRPYTLQASIVINASPRQVWAILTDLSAYPRWNPFIISAHGRLRAGGTLTNQMRDSASTANITRRSSWPYAQIASCAGWARSSGRIFDGEHAFLIQPLGRSGTGLPSGSSSLAWPSRCIDIGCRPTPCRSSGR